MLPKSGLVSLVLGGLAAYGMYKYSKMTSEQKQNLKEKGKKFFDDNVPQDLKNIFGTKKTHPENSYE